MYFSKRYTGTLSSTSTITPRIKRNYHNGSPSSSNMQWAGASNTQCVRGAAKFIYTSLRDFFASAEALEENPFDLLPTTFEQDDSLLDYNSSYLFPVFKVGPFEFCPIGVQSDQSYHYGVLLPYLTYGGDYPNYGSNWYISINGNYLYPSTSYVDYWRQHSIRAGSSNSDTAVEITFHMYTNTDYLYIAYSGPNSYMKIPFLSMFKCKDRVGKTYWYVTRNPGIYTGTRYFTNGNSYRWEHCTHRFLDPESPEYNVESKTFGFPGGVQYGGWSTREPFNYSDYSYFQYHIFVPMTNPITYGSTFNIPLILSEGQTLTQRATACEGLFTFGDTILFGSRELQYDTHYKINNENWYVPGDKLADSMGSQEMGMRRYSTIFLLKY